MIKISIVIPAYNRRDEVIALVQALSLQSRYIEEIIVVDDGSTDSTYEHLCSLQIPLLHVYRITNSERGYARNYGAYKAKGDYINFFDSDDRVYPNHCEVVVQLASANSCPPWIITSSDIYNYEANTTSTCKAITSSFPESLRFGNPISINCVFIRRDISHKFPFNDNRTLSGSEDYELWLRLSLHVPPLVSSIVTSAIVNHPGRSVNVLKPHKAKSQILYLCDLVASNSSLTNRTRLKKQILGNLYLYLSLQLSLSSRHRVQALYYAFKGIRYDINSVVLYKSLVVLKKLLTTF